MELKNINDLKDAMYNPRLITDIALSGLRNSLKEFGDLSGIVFNKQTGNLIAGHQRKKILIEEFGDKLIIEDNIIKTPKGDEYAIRVVDWDIQKEKLANITANNPHIQGNYDTTLQELVDELKESDSELIDMLNINNLDLESLVAEEEWEGMPEFDQQDKTATRNIIVSFSCNNDIKDFAELISQNITEKTKSIWYPKQQNMDTESKRYE